MKILIYGANGYTGKLIIEKAILQCINIVISGINKTSITKVGDEIILMIKKLGGNAKKI